MKLASGKDRAAMLHFFRDRPLAEALFQELAAYVDTLGDTVVTSTKSRVAFGRRTKFLWVHTAAKDGIQVAFLHPELIPSPRLRSGPVGKRHAHHLKVTGPLDAELKRWIAQAFKSDA